jgi:Ca2+-binding EF-hand superfamily protein
MHEYATEWTDDLAAEFRRFDGDDDGLITPSECLRAIQSMSRSNASLAGQRAPSQKLKAANR